MKKELLASKAKSIARKAYITATGIMLLTSNMIAQASGIESVTINQGSTADPFAAMGKVIGLIVTIFRYVGVGVAIYGAYDLFMGITQEGQMEKKTKGIIFLFVGAALFSIKWILGPNVLNVIS